MQDVAYFCHPNDIEQDLKVTWYFVNLISKEAGRLQAIKSLIS